MSTFNFWIILIAAAAVLCLPLQARQVRHAAGQARLADGSRCSRCPPGWGVARRCGDHGTADTTCSPCRPGDSFSPHHSSRAACLLCSRCGPGLFAAHTCTPTRDTLCMACDPLPAQHHRNEDYRRRCRPPDDDDVLTAAPAEGEPHFRREVLQDAGDVVSRDYDDGSNVDLNSHRQGVFSGSKGRGRHLGRRHGAAHDVSRPGRRPALASYGLSQSTLLSARSKSDMASSILADPSPSHPGLGGATGRTAQSRLPHSLFGTLGALLGDEEQLGQREYTLLQRDPGTDQAGPAYSVLTDDGPVQVAAPHTSRPPPPRHPTRLSSPINWGRPSAPSVNTRQSPPSSRSIPLSPTTDMPLASDREDMNAEEVGRLMM